MADVVAKQVSVRDLKTHLSEWLARAHVGEVVELTSHRRSRQRNCDAPSTQLSACSPYCSARPSGVRLTPFPGADFKLPASVWAQYDWTIQHCVLRSSNEPILV